MITAKADGITFTWKEGKTGSLRTYQKERAQEIKKECEKHSLIIRKTEKKEKKVYPPLLYDDRTAEGCEQTVWIVCKGNSEYYATSL